MAYELRFDVDEDILRITATGQRSLETMQSIAREIMKACAEKARQKVLFDVRGMEGHLATFESYEIVATQFPKMRNRNILSRCALLGGKDVEREHKFFETLALNRGFMIRAFTDPDEALSWLKK